MAVDNPKFGKGIGVAAGFDLGAQKPLDARDTVATIEERNLHVTNNRAYEGMLVFVEENKITYQLVNGEWKKFVFDQADFKESFADAIEETNDRIETLEGLVVGGEGEGLNKVIADVAANKTAIEKLNGEVDEEGSVAKAVADEANLRKQADNSLAGRIAVFEANGANDVAALTNRVKANEDKLDGLEEGCATVQAAIDKAEADAKAHAEQKIADLVDSAPDAMNTLNELAKAINDNKGIYDAWVIEHNQAMATMKSDLQKEIDADVKVEKDRAEGQEAAIRQEMANAIGNYAVEADPENGIDAKDASGLRKEIAEADAAIRQEMAKAVAGVHGHDNKAVLDGIDADKVAAWDGAQSAAETKAAELDAALKTELQKEIDDDVKVVADALANEKKADVEGTLAKQIADVNARLNQNGDIEKKIAQAESDIDGLQGLVGYPVQAGEGEEGDIPATGLHLALDNAKKELEQDILDEKERAEEQERLIRQELADEAAEIRGEMAAELGNYTVEAAEGVEGKEASGLRKEIEDAHKTMDQAMADMKAELQGEIDDDVKVVANELAKQKDAEQEGTLANQIKAEKARALEQEAAIRQELANEKAALQTEIDADITAESKLRVAEEQRIEKALTDTADAIRGEFAAADAALYTTISAEIDADVKAEKGRAELAEQGLQAAIDTINAAETGILDQAKAHANNLNQAMDARVKDAEAFVKSHDHSVMEQGIADNKAAIEAEVGKEGVQGNRDKAIAAALESYSTTEEVKTILGNVVNSLALTMENDQVVLKLGGADGIALTSVSLDITTDAEIEAIIAGLDEEDAPAEQE